MMKTRPYENYLKAIQYYVVCIIPILFYAVKYCQTSVQPSIWNISFPRSYPVSSKRIFYAVSKDKYFYAELKYSWVFFPREAYELLQYDQHN